MKNFYFILKGKMEKKRGTKKQTYSDANFGEKSAKKRG